jgi:hypothetical protein
MASYGYRSNHINDIRINLRDRYSSGFPILKELIQNADDAKARRIVFGMHPGFKGQSSHPLLQGPGFWVFNDGQFNKEDEGAIRSIGLNSKAGESGSIGKFGLGLKSVHHLCEAFFYVAFDGERHFDVLLNPWRNLDTADIFHTAWDQDEAKDYDALRSVVSKGHLDKNGSTWFFMWIPLRQTDHVRRKDGKPYGGIVDKYPGNDVANGIHELLGPDLNRRVRSVLPLLRSLESIEFAGDGRNPGFKIQISFEEGSKRVDHSSPELVSVGSVGVGDAVKGKLRFRIQQKAMPGALPFSQFQKLNVWPKTERSNGDGETETVSDKSEAEGAVLVSGAAADGDEAKLSIDWAVFLPMEEGMSYEYRLDKSQQRYQIVLHGQFFVDAGRRGIAGFRHLADPLIVPSPDLDDADLHTGWNQSVAQQVILPQLLPALAEFANDLDESEKEELARAILLARSKSSATSTGKGFWDNYRNFVCQGQAWVRMITLAGPKWSYVKVTQDSRFLLLPKPPRDDPQRPWKIFPRLKELTVEGCLLLDEKAPSLLLTHANWDAPTLLRMLNGVDFDEVCSSTGMSYLVSFLSPEERRFAGGSDVQNKLIAMLRYVLRKESLQTFRSLRSIFQELVSLVKPEYRFAVGTRKPDAPTGLDDVTLKILMGSETDKLLVPMDLDPEDKDASKGEPTEAEIRNLLKSIDLEISSSLALHDQQSAKSVENLLRAAQSVLALLSDKKDERGQTIRVNRSLRVLTATCARTERNMAVSFDELQKAHQLGLLFKRGFGHGVATYPVASALAKLLPGEQIWVVDGDIANWVQRGEQSALPISSADDMTAAFVTLGKSGRSLALANMTVRSNFIRTISPTAVRGADVIRGMRFVLHGSTVHHGDIDSTLWINAGREDEVWVKLKCMVEPDSWNVVDSNLAGAIAPNNWSNLGIRKVGADEVIEHMMGGCGIDKVEASQFTETEISDILIRIADEKLWKALPIHRDISGGFGPIDERCYVDPNGLADPQFLKGVRLIQLGKNQKLRHQQNQWVPAWSCETTIERALNQTDPERYWDLILVSASKIAPSSLEKISEFKSARWLPLANGGSISPEDIIDVGPLETDIDRLASECGYCYAGILAISKEVRAHANFPTLRPFFANDKSGLERLGQLMVEAGGHLVGNVPSAEISEALIEQLAELNALPAWSIVKAAIHAVGSDHLIDVTEHLVKEIQKPLPVEKLVEILNEISAQGRSKRHVAFNLYLQQLAQYREDLPNALGNIQLLAQDGQWKSADVLCVGVQGVARGSVLHDAQAKILEGYLASHAAKRETSTNFEGSGAAGEDGASSLAKDQTQLTLVNYFKPWRELMPSGPVGAFFALMGPSCRNLAVEWLKPHSFEYFSDQLSWVEPKSRSSPVWDIKRQEHTKLDALEMLQFLPTITNAKEIYVVSLMGNEICVPVDTQFDGLVMGNLTWAGTRGGKSYFQMRLREVNRPEQYDKAALSNMLRKTCECILREAYNQREPNLGPLWETLEKSNQLELAVARGLILDRLPYELRNLRSVKKSPALCKWQDSFKKLESSRAEKTEAKQATDQVERDIAEAKSALSKLMTSDPQVQEAVLNGIRHRVEHNQYKVSSIAFEILQNADDAVTELQSLMQGDSTVAHQSHHVGRFVMEMAGDTVRFVHWGRPINYMGHGSARNESYGEDLQRMLVLAASDKDEATGLTGKFGLGFKSVLLATDAPCILSGDLKAKIVGGCLPTQWIDAAGAADSLQRLRLPDATGLRGTVVEFKVNRPEKQAQVTDRFSALAGLQCVFSKEIRSIQVNETIHRWLPTPLTEDFQHIEIGEVQLPTKSGLSKSNLLNFRMTNGCFALRLGSRGFVRFQEDADHFPPGIWVTAPTREPAANGFILNSQFELDTGRGGLPHGESAGSNLAMADRLGSTAADLVLQATRRSRDNWERARSQFKLAKDVTASEFWATFWEQISALKNDEIESVRLLGKFGHRLLERYMVIAGEFPNGLSAPLSAFVNLEKVCLVLNARWEKLFESLNKWPEFIDRFPVTGWVSPSVAAQLKASSTRTDEFELPEMSVKLLLDLVPSNGCGADLMDKLCQLLGEPSLEETERIKEKIGGFLFQAKDGSWHFGNQLLKTCAEFDKQCLPFAPSCSILHSSYQGQGLALIQRYAGFDRPQGYVIAEWILASPPDPHAGRVAALRFLLGNTDVRSWIGLRIHGSWIEDIETSSPYLVDFSIQERNLLHVMFMADPLWEHDDDLEEGEPEPGPALKKGNEALVAIVNWWRENRVRYLREFDNEFWPSGVPRIFASTTENRSSWMTLFALGLMQRHGRVRDFQNRGFIDKMQSKRFWDVFTNIDPRKDGQAWIDVLTAYGDLQDEDEEYGMWMDNFPRLYRVARWFDVYVQLFLGLEYRKMNETALLLAPNADSLMSGSGQIAPSVQRSLRLGVHVITRELLRCKVITGETAYSLAFKPGKSVKNLFGSMGFDQLIGDDVGSHHIYEVLCDELGADATFDGDCDIPLIIMARNSDLQLRILGESIAEEGQFDDF